MGICLVHLIKLHCIILNLLFFWFMKRKNFGNQFLQPDSLYNSEDAVIYLHH